jgi:hypothetical protein
VEQRTRNRIIETLEWFLECESTPPELGVNELINSWEDWAHSPLLEDQFPVPVYTQVEDKLLRQLSSAIDVFCDVTPQSIKDEAAAIARPEWAAVIAAARHAYPAMMQRGRLSEDEELLL